MPNSYFQFKQFTIQQGNCAMKVTTDGCFFGAWVANTCKHLSINNRVLDIGAGTGLLSIMLAQKCAAQIDAVEIDIDAAKEANANFEASPWKSQLKIYHTDIQQFEGKSYDCIITNPPFFDNDLKSEDIKRNLALHSSALSLEELLANITRLLLPTGQFAILLPYHRVTYFEDLATANGYYLHRKTLVQQTPKHNYFRAMLLFGKLEKTTQITELVIKENNQYTADFTYLLQDYYLHL